MSTARAKNRAMDAGLDLCDNQDAVLLEDQVQLCPRCLKSPREGAIATGAEVRLGQALTGCTDLP